MSSEDSLDSLIQDAEEASKEYKEKRSKIQKVKEDLRNRVENLKEEEVFSDDDYSTVMSYIEKGEYGKAREAIHEAKKGSHLQFEEEDLQAFAEGFTDTWKDLQGAVEDVRTQMMELQDSVDIEKQKRYIYGSTGMNLSEIEKVLDVMEEFTRSGVDADKMARALRGYNSSLKISDTKKVLQKIQEEAQK